MIPQHHHENISRFLTFRGTADCVILRGSQGRLLLIFMAGYKCRLAWLLFIYHHPLKVLVTLDIGLSIICCIHRTDYGLLPRIYLSNMIRGLTYLKRFTLSTRASSISFMMIFLCLIYNIYQIKKSTVDWYFAICCLGLP